MCNIWSGLTLYSTTGSAMDSFSEKSTVKCTQYSIQCKQCSVHSLMYTVQFRLYNEHSAVYICTMNRVQILCKVQCPVPTSPQLASCSLGCGLIANGGGFRPFLDSGLAVHFLHRKSESEKGVFCKTHIFQMFFSVLDELFV